MGCATLIAVHQGVQLVKIGFVAKRFFQVFVTVLVTLASVYVLRGQQIRGAMKDAAVWALISGAIFAGTVVYNHQKNKPCDLCRDAD
jgi:hypothetical protein